MHHKFLPRLQAVLSEWKNRSTERKELQGGFLFTFLWLMYCMVSMFTECICLVMLNKMNDKKKKFWCAIWKFALASLFMFYFFFCPLLGGGGGKRRLYSKAVLAQHSLPRPSLALIRAVHFITGALRLTEPCSWEHKGGRTYTWPLPFHQPDILVCSHLNQQYHFDIPGVGRWPPTVLPITEWSEPLGPPSWCVGKYF